MSLAELVELIGFPRPTVRHPTRGCLLVAATVALAVFAVTSRAAAETPPRLTTATVDGDGEKTPRCVVEPPAPAEPCNAIAAQPEASPKRPSFGAVARLHYRFSINGESEFQHGAFILLPADFFIVESMTVLTAVGSSAALDFAAFELETTMGRPIYPSAPWGKVLGLAVRYQVATNISSIGSVGLQWNISDIPFLRWTRKAWPWKSFVQVFATTDKAFDVFHWYSLPVIPGWLDLHGTTTVSFLSDGGRFTRAVQDLVVSVMRKEMKGIKSADLYVRHGYQNIDEFFNRSRGSQFAIGARISY